MRKKYLCIIILILSSILLYGNIFQLLKNKNVIIGAEEIDKYINLLSDKNVGIVANHSSMINNTHLVDSLLSLNVNIAKIFSPEHGFRGNVDAGKYFSDHIDSITGLEIISLYGKNFKPTKDQLTGVDIIIFDLQDVGVRFYTYISTLHYMMEACAENNISLILLDRPNPNGFYIDGPILEKEFSSFVGVHPIPLVYGMTIGELALMINEEKWLKNEIHCDLQVIKCRNYNHNTRYHLPVNPSPNLQTMEAIYLYPSLGLFEGTAMSIGRGTNSPFQVIGHPKFPDSTFSFTPKSIPGICENPLFINKKCYGLNLLALNKKELSNLMKVNISILIYCYKKLNPDVEFFNNYFNLLAGNSDLKEKIKTNTPENEIQNSWQKDIIEFKKIRKNYLLYNDFKN